MSVSIAATKSAIASWLRYAGQHFAISVMADAEAPSMSTMPPCRFIVAEEHLRDSTIERHRGRGIIYFISKLSRFFDAGYKPA